MNQQKSNKKRKCNDNNERELSRQVQKNKHHQYTIEVLNYHCLGEIISYLSPVDRLNLEQLCKKIKDAGDFAWRRIKHLASSNDWYNNNNVREHSIKMAQSQSIAQKILVRCGNYLESLHLDWCGDLLMSLVINMCHNLKKLTIDYPKFAGENFLDAFKNMKNLKCISIKISNHNVFEMLKSLPKDIEEISLEGWIGGKYRRPIFPANFKKFSDKWKTLHSLTLKSFTIDQTAGILFSENHPLTHLELAWCTFSGVDPKEFLMPTHKNLKHLSVIGTLLNEDSIRAIANNFKTLKHLDIRRCTLISQEAIKDLGKLENLEEINLYATRVNDYVLSNFKNLKILNCPGTSVGDTGVIGILDRSPDLERLDLCFTKITANTLLHAANLSNYREKKLFIRVDQTIIENFNPRNEIFPFLEFN